MISLVKEIPKLNLPLAEAVKINCTYNLYRDIAIFWVQDNERAVISMLDGNMVIYNNCANIEELRKFIEVISPNSVFSDAKTMEMLFEQDFKRACVVKSEHQFKSIIASDILNSEEIYNLLNVRELQLPPYEYFAVDFCHRLNHGQLKYFAVKQKCIAIGIFDGQAVLVNGIASHQKGMGTVAIWGLLARYNCAAIAVCEKEVMPFYLKNNFSYTYDVGYWRKSS